MTRDELLETLRACGSHTADLEEGHVDADNALLAYINDEEITEAFDAIEKWYA